MRMKIHFSILLFIQYYEERAWEVGVGSWEIDLRNLLAVMAMERRIRRKRMKKMEMGGGERGGLQCYHQVSSVPSPSLRPLSQTYVENSINSPLSKLMQSRGYSTITTQIFLLAPLIDLTTLPQTPRSKRRIPKLKITPLPMYNPIDERDEVEDYMSLDVVKVVVKEDGRSTSMVGMQVGQVEITTDLDYGIRDGMLDDSLVDEIQPIEEREEHEDEGQGDADEEHWNFGDWLRLQRKREG